jgi:hypothetical protein
MRHVKSGVSGVLVDVTRGPAWFSPPKALLERTLGCLLLWLEEVVWRGANLWLGFLELF